VSFYIFYLCGACSSTADWSLRSSYEVSSVRGGLASGARSETFDDGTSSVIEDEAEEEDEQADEQADVEIPIEAQLSQEEAPDWYVPIRSDACT
jgi:hypothetical protein